MVLALEEDTIIIAAAREKPPELKRRPDAKEGFGTGSRRD